MNLVFSDNQSKKILDIFTKLSKVELLIENSIGDFVKFSCTIAKFSFLEGD